VLTMERVHGVKVDAVPRIARIEHDFTPVADELTRAYLKGITIDGFFHADPHPGNVFVVLPGARNPRTPAEVVRDDRRDEARPGVTPMAQVEADAVRAAQPAPADVDVRLALIDFGMTARLSANMREKVTRILMALGDHRGDDVAATLIEMGEARPEFDRVGYTREIAGIVARNVELTAAEAQAGRLLFEVTDISYRNGLRLPAEMTLLAKALFNLDGVTRALDPSFSPIEAIRDYSNQLAAERAKKDFSPRRLFQIATESTDFLATLPHRLELITQRLATGDFETRVEVPQLVVLLNGLQKVANRVFTGLVLAGIVVASALLMPYRRSLATTGFVIAAVLSLAMVVNILITDRTRRPGS
jgi:ubiquinone biosynthesis protein